MQGPQAPGRGHQACPLSVGKSAVWIQAQPQGGQGEEVLGGVAETPRWTGSLLGSTRATAAPSSRRPPAAALSRPPRAMLTPTQLSSAGSRQPEVEDGRPSYFIAGHLGSVSSFPALFVFECIRDTLMQTRFAGRALKGIYLFGDDSLKVIVSTHLERPHSPAFSPGTSSHGLLLLFPVPRPQAHQAARASRRPRTGQQVAPGLHGRRRVARRAPREVASERGRCASAAATRGPGANVASRARQGLGRARVAPRSRPHCFRPGTLPRAVRADYARVPVTGERAWGRRLRPSRRRGRGRVGTSARFPPRRAGVGQGRGWRQVAGTWGTGPRVAWGGEPPPRPSERPPGMMINHTTAPRWPRQSPVPGAGPQGDPGGRGSTAPALLQRQRPRGPIGVRAGRRGDSSVASPEHLLGPRTVPFSALGEPGRCAAPALVLSGASRAQSLARFAPSLPLQSAGQTNPLSNAPFSPENIKRPETSKSACRRRRLLGPGFKNQMPTFPDSLWHPDPSRVLICS
ncbi:uncharacterized protein [Macaca fascicularis]|uniref:uncharacterized protein n=1 Tax=Macaca fascicularis TaxID=9541 RepID=UPI0032B0253C